MAAVEDVPAISGNPLEQWSLSREVFRWTLPDVARFAALSGNQLCLDLAPGQSVREAMPYLLGTAFAALCYQRGEWLLHASAVAVDGRAMLICGSSGRGKSTTAAALANRGYPLLSDDISRLEFSPTGPIVHADGRMLKLYDQTATDLGLADRRGERVLSRLDKVYVSPADESPPLLPLGGLYALFPARASDEPSLTRMAPLEACDQLLQRTFRRKFALALLGGQEVLHRSSQLVRDFGVWRLSLPRDLSRLPDGLRLLADQWHVGRIHRGIDD